MSLNDIMIQSLTDLLEENETLMHPICGMLDVDDGRFEAFLGFTHKYLLIVIRSGKTSEYAMRIPLDIKSVKIKQSAVLNLFLFGRILCVVNEKGIFTENDYFAWNSIKKIEYYPEFPGKHKTIYNAVTRAHLIIGGQAPTDYKVKVIGFPVYGLLIVKKHNPDVVIEMSKRKTASFIFMTIFPSLAALIMALIL